MLSQVEGTFLIPRNIKTGWESDFPELSEIWICGGDGTFHYYLNHFGIPKVPIAILPDGTGNDAFRTSLMPRRKAAWIKEYQSSKIVSRDLGRCNGHVFHNSCGSGFDTRVSLQMKKSPRWVPKSISYQWAVLQKLSSPIPLVSHKTAENEAPVSFFMIAINIGPYIGGGFPVTPFSGKHQGYFDYCLIPPISWYQRWLYLPTLLRGKHPELPWVVYEKCTSFRTQLNVMTDVQLDGDLYEFDHLEVDMIHHAYQLRVSSKYPG